MFIVALSTIAKTWKQLVRRREMKVSPTERQTPYDITHIWNLKYDTNELFYEAD